MAFAKFHGSYESNMLYWYEKLKGDGRCAV